MTVDLPRRLVAEGLGTALLVTAVVGSGVMADRLSDGNDAVALLANTIATGAALVALIHTFGPVSGTHFNPVVTLADALLGALGARDGVAYAVVQVAGGNTPLSLPPSSNAKLCCIFARFSGLVMSSMSSSKITVFASRSAASTSGDSG